MSPVKNYNPNFNNKQEEQVVPLKKTKSSDSKLQTFGNKNIIGYEPFVVHSKGMDSFKKINGYGGGNGGERYFLK